MNTTRRTVLQVLRESAEPLSIAQVAEAVGVHVNTVRFHLDALIGTGQVEQVRTAPSGPGRPATRLRAVAAMDRTGPRTYLPLAQLLLDDVASAPRPRERARRAGRRWGRQLAERVYADPTDAVDGLLEALDELQFAPHHSESGDIELRHCPFLELAAPSGGLVCAIHLGLMQGVLEGTDTDVRVERLDPFVRPDLCCARLGTAS